MNENNSPLQPMLTLEVDHLVVFDDEVIQHVHGLLPTTTELNRNSILTMTVSEIIEISDMDTTTPSVGTGTPSAGAQQTPTQI
jgi:hypothetical protein